MAESQSPEEMLKQQKANCIFCRIIAGEMESKVVFEDERMTALLDINPAVKGHAIVMTKEHYPIMPLIPPDEFEHLFGRAAALSGSLKSAMLTKRCTLFVANGGVAGQQSPHFLFHLIPRETNDGLDAFAVKGKGINQSSHFELIKQNLYAVMRQHLTKRGRLNLLQVGKVVAPDDPSPEAERRAADPAPAASQAPLVASVPGPASPPDRLPGAPPRTPSGAPPERHDGATGAAPAPLSYAQLAQVIEENPEIKALLINNPAKLKAIIAENPEFGAIFAGIDIDRLGATLRASSGTPANAGGEPPVPAVSPVSAGSPVSAHSSVRADHPPVSAPEPVKPAAQMTLQELFGYIDAKPRLRQYLLEDSEGLKRLIPENERLTAFFAGSNVNAIIQAYQEHAKERHGVRATVEPDIRGNRTGEDETDAAPPPGPTREESEEAYWEMRGRKQR